MCLGERHILHYYSMSIPFAQEVLTMQKHENIHIGFQQL